MRISMPKSVLRSKWVRLATVAGVAAAMATFAEASAGAAPWTASAMSSHWSQPKPTIVLEHGAFADSSSWNGVIPLLRREGYPVVAAANPLRSVDTDAAYLRSVLASIKGPIILVSHSYGGVVSTEAAAGNPEVKALVYVAAFIPDVGETAGQLTGEFPGSTLLPTLQPVPYTLPDGSTGTDLYIQQDKFHHQFAADVPADKAALMAVDQRPVAASVFDEKVTAAAWKTIPSWDVVSTQDLNIPPAAQLFMAHRANARITKVASSHVVMVSHPEAVADVIEQAAFVTTH